MSASPDVIGAPASGSCCHRRLLTCFFCVRLSATFDSGRARAREIGRPLAVPDSGSGSAPGGHRVPNSSPRVAAATVLRKFLLQLCLPCHNASLSSFRGGPFIAPSSCSLYGLLKGPPACVSNRHVRRPPVSNRRERTSAYSR